MLLLAAGLRLWGLATVPPGLHHDEAFHLLSARSMLDGGGVPIYITGNQGNEPMFAYLATGTMALLGEAPWAGRLLSAWAGLLCVACTLRLGGSLFPGRPVGLFAGLALAGLFWHLVMSRWGTQPMLSATAAAGTMLGLWHGARTGRRWPFVVAGLCLAFGLWSYLAFRLLPLVVLAAWLALLAARSVQARRLVAGGLLAAGVALVLYAPLGVFFARHPEWFFNRFGQVTDEDMLGPRLAAQAGQVLAGLFVPGAGDENWRQNLAGRPAFDPLQAVLFGLGLVAALRGWRSPASAALGAWLLVGLAPSVLTEFPPQHGRTVMVTPALALLIGLGAAVLWESRQRWLRGAAIAALAASPVLTARDYFRRWAADEHLFVAFDAGLYAVARQLRERPSEAALYETPVYRDYPTFEYSLGQQAYPRFRAFNGRACTVLPLLTTVPTTYAVIVAEDSRTLPALQSAFSASTISWLPDSAGRTYAALLDVPAGQSVQPTLPGIAAEFGETLRLREYRLEQTRLAGGESLPLTLTWELLAATPAQLSYFVHLLGPARADGSTVYAQRDSQPCDNAYPTWQWRPGELMIDYINVPLPADLPAGSYEVAVGWYDTLTLARVAVTQGPASNDSVRVGTLTVGD